MAPRAMGDETRRSRSTGVRVIRNWVNFWSGWAIVAGLTLMIAFSDPLAVAWPKEGWTGMDREAIATVLGTGLAVLACHALLVKPRVLVQGDDIDVVNPVFRWTFTRSDIEVPSQSREAIYESLKVDGRTIRAVGTERSTLAGIWGKEHYLAALAIQVPEPADGDGPSGGLSRRWSIPSPMEVVIILLYVGYVGVGWLSGAGIV